MNAIIVSCYTIRDEVNVAIAQTGIDYPVLWIESGLHDYPDKLRKMLQGELNRIDHVEAIIMAFGYCGNSLVGLQSPHARMVVPRVDDCISLLLGSCKRRQEISQEMGTYFLTSGWIDNEEHLWKQYHDWIAKYGQKKADYILKVMLANYRRLAIIDTGAYPLADYLERSKDMAQEFNLEHQVLPGTMAYVKRLLTGPWDDELFINLQPGEVLTLAHLGLEQLLQASGC